MSEMSERMQAYFGGEVPAWYKGAILNRDYHTILSFLHGVRLGLMTFAWWKDGVQYVGTCGTTLAEALAVVETEVKRMKVHGDGN